jgi:hypothetical protein
MRVLGAAEISGYTIFFGKVDVGDSPSLTDWKESLMEGWCRLLLPKAHFRSVACTSGSVCGGAGKCEAFPVPMSVGTLKLSVVDYASRLAAWFF